MFGTCFEADVFDIKAHMGHGKPGKSWNLLFQFPGLESHGILRLTQPLQVSSRKKIRVYAVFRRPPTNYMYISIERL